MTTIFLLRYWKKGRQFFLPRIPNLSQTQSLRMIYIKRTQLSTPGQQMAACGVRMCLSAFERPVSQEEFHVFKWLRKNQQKRKNTWSFYVGVHKALLEHGHLIHSCVAHRASKTCCLALGRVNFLPLIQIAFSASTTHSHSCSLPLAPLLSSLSSHTCIILNLAITKKSNSEPTENGKREIFEFAFDLSTLSSLTEFLRPRHFPAYFVFKVGVRSRCIF